MHRTTYLPNQLHTPRKLLSAKLLYLLLAVVGSITTWSLLLKIFLQNGSSISLFFQNAFANASAAEVAVDLLISSVVFLCFSFTELKRLGLAQRWLYLYVFITFGIGLSCALPLFFYFREQALEDLKLVSQEGV